MSFQGVIYIICIMLALLGAFVAGSNKVWTTALAFLVVAAFVLALAWPVLSA